MQDSTTPKWLRNLQESSWELEFLLSGGAIFTLIQASGFFTDLVQSLQITAWLTGTHIYLLLGVLGIQVLTMGFGLHLLLRALWVALVCVTYLYPDGARPEGVRWRRPFRAQAPDSTYFHDLLIRLNRVCATVMFLAITSTLLLGGIIIILVVLATLPSILLNIVWSPWYDWYTVTLLLFVLLYIVDIVLFGALRRTPGLVWLVFPAFWLFDRLSLRVVLQPGLWLFSSHVPRLRLAGLLAAFLSVALAYSYALIYQDLHLPNLFDRRIYRNQLAPGPALNYRFYLDELNGQRVYSAALPSRYIDKPFLEVFMIYRKQYELDIKSTDSVNYISDLLLLRIDDSLYRRVQWYPTYKQANDQMGMTAVLPIGQLKVGPHRLLIGSRADTSRHLLIPFWKTE
ncbi:hypothetical protein F0P96_09790 [Hymenobacter busanensis]|uniref:Uncharacterized protein n=1 Tax=Hymenobacter busanensis TaxID=2607656 RepID=A0A7L4ZYQ4_9BACT|nr:hypothetical protein [Hymenobacter busanensis]KAA9333260.1 hypothetical protein F0P96_09790 [Hymenobacter busanensis]QHJ08063.1 hypothetical protein GUY19_12530 [Hymenobacter busanensis]